MTNNLRKQIVDELKTFYSHVYYKSAPDGASFPYIVYEISTVYSDSALESRELEVNLWDDDSVTVEAFENKADAIVNRFNCLTDAKDGNYPTFFRSNRSNIDDPDKHLKRIRITFEIHNFSD